MLPSAQRIPLPYFADASVWFQIIRQWRLPVWLDSGRPQSEYGRYDILAAAPDITITTTGDVTDVQDADGNLVESSSENPFDILKRYQPAVVSPGSELPFCGGYMGYFSYDLGRRFERLPEQAERDINMPELCVGRYLWAVVQDHEQQQAWLTVLPGAEFPEALLEKSRFHDLKSNLEKTDKFFNISSFESNIKEEDYLKSIGAIRDYIAAGDCYQVNYAQRFSADCSGDPFTAYQQLRAALPSPFSGYIETPAATILSLSPERFIEIKDGVAETRPIKGTIARGHDAQSDSFNAETLQASTKNRAENLMIVDLLRNDLSKHCDQVTVPALFALQSFANVHHLVSTVEGKLRPGTHPLDVLAGSFPGGSITGAPKIRAMEIIEELEPTRRAIYCGSVGYLSADGRVDTSIAIRTLVCADDKMYCWGGGGIVADSDAQDEYQESLTKVRLLMETLEKHFAPATVASAD